jgi:predicted nucleic acid-binding protein
VALILDSGVLIAALDRDDREHDRCRALIESVHEPLVIPGPTLPEVDYVLGEHVGPAPMIGLIGEIAAGAFAVADLDGDDYVRIAELLDRYADLEVGFVDAAILSITERLEEPKLATLDHRHFSVMRPRHVDALDLMP